MSEYQDPDQHWKELLEDPIRSARFCIECGEQTNLIGYFGWKRERCQSCDAVYHNYLEDNIPVQS